MKRIKPLYLIFSLFFFGAAVFHFLGIFNGYDGLSPTTHLIYVLVNVICIPGILFRPKLFVFTFPLLVLEQYYSHGTRMVEWMQVGRLDWVSMFDIMFFNLVLGILMVEQFFMKKKPELRLCRIR